MVGKKLGTFRGVALAIAVAFAAVLLVPGAASAQYREFRGKIDKINKKKMIVDNRMGDKLNFVKDASVTVEPMEGEEGELTWESLKKGTWVTVYWKMMDKPRKAYRVKLQPTPADQEDE